MILVTKKAKKSSKPQQGSLKNWFNCIHQSSCRFTCFSECSLLSHHLEHARQELLNIIEPYGFQLHLHHIVSKKIENRTLLEKCFFPKCDFCFDPLQGEKNILEHLNSHLNSYLFYPCYNCLGVFYRLEELRAHFAEKQACREKNDNCLQDRYRYDFQNLATGTSSFNQLIAREDYTSCTYCDNSVRQDLYKLHLKFSHPNEESAGEPETKKRKRKVDKNRSQLSSHQIEHLYHQLPQDELANRANPLHDSNNSEQPLTVTNCEFSSQSFKKF